MLLSHETPRVGEWGGGQYPSLPRLPPALHCCSLGGWGLLARFVAFPSWLSWEVTSSSVPWDGSVRGRPVLLCIVLLLSLFFLSPAWGGASPPASCPVEEGVGVNKADDRGRLLSLHGLASLLSSVRRLCGQVSEGVLWGGPGTPCPPDAPLHWSVPSHPWHGMLVSTSREKNIFPQENLPFWVALQPRELQQCDFSST